MKFLLILTTCLTSLFFVCVNQVFASDTTSPISTLTLDPPSSTGQNGWYNQSVDLLINSSDSDSGVAKISYILDSKPTVEKLVEASVNLIDNPSFEEHHNYIPFYWDRPTYSSDIYVSPNYSVDGVYSLRFKSNIWPVNYMTNASYMVTAGSFETYFFSAWLKTKIIGFGTNYEIMAKVNGQNQLIYRSPSYYNQSNFTYLNKTFTTPSGTQGLFVNLYSLGWGDSYFDSLYLGKITSESSISFNVSEEGVHNINYFAQDQAGNIEQTNNSSFKIDIAPPSTWQNFDYTQSGNDHTLILSIDVTDVTSGIDLISGQFQYYIEGIGWGVYTDLKSCSSPFLLDQWRNPTVSYITLSTKAHIVTPAINFCNSNWIQDKKIRFKAKDIAGNEAISPEFSINSPWIYATNFDVASNHSIQFNSTALVDGYVHSSGDIVGVNSMPNIQIKNYNSSVNTSAQYYISENTLITLPENKLPETDGKYKFVGNMTLDIKTINNYDNKTICTLVAIDGSLTISKDLILKDSSSCLIMLVTGNLNVSNSVENISGFFIIDGVFDTGSSNKALIINGGVVADKTVLSRSLKGKANLDNPSETFNYSLNLLFNASGLVSTIENSTYWYEL